MSLSRKRDLLLKQFADALLFASPEHWRALQNLGGIGNVTIVPPGGAIDGVRAFDTGPGVTVLDVQREGLIGSCRALSPVEDLSHVGGPAQPVLVTEEHHILLSHTRRRDRLMPEVDAVDGVVDLPLGVSWVDPFDDHKSRHYGTASTGM